MSDLEKKSANYNGLSAVSSHVFLASENTDKRRIECKSRPSSEHTQLQEERIIHNMLVYSVSHSADIIISFILAQSSLSCVSSFFKNKPHLKKC